MPATYAVHRAQIEAILRSWGMPKAEAELTAEVMAWTDLHGIDSHGISMLTVYHERWKNGRLNLKAQPKIIRETPVSALINGNAGLGHPTARFAMSTAIAKAKTVGMAISSVRNSAHFGACGYYAKMATDAGLIGMVTTSASYKQVAPAGGREARFGTDPLAFGAPGPDGKPFLLDMATTTTAAGKIRNRQNEGLPTPPGWLLTKEGLPSTDPLEAKEKGGFITSLGGTLEGGSYKGYGLAAMVNILSACLSGSTLITSPMHMKQPFGMDIGHFFMAIDPGLFRDPAEFRADVTSFCDALRSAKPVNPANPVMVAGDPEWRCAAQRSITGIPVGEGLLKKLRAIADEHNAPWMLD
ncbi:MAG: Ldh family oxidoreductase [Thermodesulfobacteriota bacterium]